MYNQVTEKSRKQWIEEFIKGVSGFNNIYIYGAGSYGKRCGLLFKNAGIKVTGYCVTSMENNPQEIDGISVVEADAIKSKDEDTLFIIAALPKYRIDIKNKLAHMGEGYHNYIDLPDNTEYLIDAKTADRIRRPLLEVTTKIGCKIMCRYCPQDVLINTYFSHPNRPSEMSFDVFKKCIDKTPQNCIVDFCGFSEPFLNTEAEKMICYAADTGRDVALYTTLVGLTKERFDKIKNIPFYYVVLHAPDKDNYAKIEMTDEYTELLKTVLHTKKADGSPFVDRANCQSTPNAKALKCAEGSGIRIGSTNLVDRAGNLRDSSIYEKVYNTGRLECGMAAGLNSNILLPDGTVVLCCMDFGLRHELGNLLESSYDEVTNGAGMMAVRDAMNTEDMWCVCRNCSVARKRE